MNRRLTHTLAAFTFALFLALPAAPYAAEAPKLSKPNVLLILADDMGFSDAGCYGGEIQTPNLDKLALGGLRYTQFYNTARCWPSRACIMTGYYAQAVRRDAMQGIEGGGQGLRPRWARLLPELLKPLGYRTYHSGKWHIDGRQLAGGFNHSYCLEDADRKFNPKTHFEDDVKLPPVEPRSGYYTATAVAEHAIKYLKEHAEKYAGRPFFSYVAFTEPHFPLQAPTEDIARYRDEYRQGWDAVREARWRRMLSMGIVHCASRCGNRKSARPTFSRAFEILGAGEVRWPLPWRELNQRQRAFQAAKMPIHAAMVDRMDREIGRLLDQLKAMGVLDNTAVFFLSDNGASAEIMVRGDGHDPLAVPGSAASYLLIGPGWSSASNTPLRRHKTWVHEGGISTPLIVHWPSGIKSRGELRRNPGHITDLAPTILELAGGTWPQTLDGQPVPPPHGKSLVPSFARDGRRETRLFLVAPRGQPRAPRRRLETGQCREAGRRVGTLRS